MPYPPDVTIRTIEVTAPVRAEAGATDIIAANHKLIVAVNEGPLVNIASSKVLFEAPLVQSSFSVQVPRTDQITIWRDKAGKALTTNPTHTYRVEQLVFHNNRWLLVRVWRKLEVPAGAGNLDLDLTFDTADTPYTIVG